MNITAETVKRALQQHSDADDALFLQRFFKTGEGQYGAGDVFIGVRVPATRKVCKEFKDLSISEIRKLLASPVHEHRLAAVILLANRYAHADEMGKQQVYDTYLRAVREGRVNNWDIVDISAEFIIGEHLRGRSRDVLFDLAKSDNIWQRRVAIVGTFGFIKQGDPSTTLLLADKLLHDPHDLIQKAVGWMLREVGKRIDRRILLDFLDKHAHDMPRTALRYSIEHLSLEQSSHYMTRKAARYAVYTRNK